MRNQLKEEEKKGEGEVGEMVCNVIVLLKNRGKINVVLKLYYNLNLIYLHSIM